MFSQWSGFGECSEPCGYKGIRTRKRTYVKAENGGKPCRGDTEEVDSACADIPCPIDCVMDDWTEWTTCSKPCGKGRKTRFRSPSIPQMYNGKPCPEDKTRQSRDC